MKRKKDKPEIKNSANHSTVEEGDIKFSRDAWEPQTYKQYF